METGSRPQALSDQLDLPRPISADNQLTTGGRDSGTPTDYFASEQSHPPAQLQTRLQLQTSPQLQRSTLASAHAHDVFSHWQGS